MNIFAVDNDPVAAARDLPDKLCNKMSTESLQLLTPWSFNTFGVKIEKPGAGGQLALFKSDRKYYGVKGFAHHPCAKWLYESPSNVHWLLEHALGLAEEYRNRYGKTHGTLYGLSEVRDLVYKHHSQESSKNHTPFVQAMPEECRIPGDPVQAYRNYLMGYKGYAEWRYSKKPDWWDEEKHAPIRKQYLAQREENLMKRRNAKYSATQRSVQS